MTSKTTLESKNPYRESSKLHSIYHFLSDGAPHTLVDITETAYFPGAGMIAMYRRRVSSAIRTIRSMLNINLNYDGSEYIMSLPCSTQDVDGTPLKTEAAAG